MFNKNNENIDFVFNKVYDYLVSYGLYPVYSLYLRGKRGKCIKVKYNSYFIYFHMFKDYRGLEVLAVAYSCNTFNFQFCDIPLFYEFLIDKSLEYLGIYKNRQCSIFEFI